MRGSEGADYGKSARESDLIREVERQVLEHVTS